MMQENGLPKGWVETTLGEIALKKQYGYTESAKFEVVGPKFLRITDIQNDFISWNTVPYCPISELDYKKYKLNIGDIVIARTGNSTGATATIKENIDAVFASYLIRFQLDENIAYFKFIDFLLRSRYWDVFVKSVKSGSAQGGANANDFALFPIKLPTLPEQKAIASILTSFDDKIELLQAQNETLENIAQTIFKEWFGKYKVGDELPEGWRVGILGDVATHSKVSVRPFENPKVEYFHFSLPAYDDGLKPIVERGEMIKSNKYIVETNAFLVSKLNPFTPRIWTIFNSQDNFICSTEFQVVKPKSEKYFSLIHCLLNSDRFTNKLSQKIKGTSSSHQRVNPQDIFDVELVIPNDTDLNTFDSIVFPLVKKKDINKIQIQTLQATRDTLLPKLMSGQLRVAEFKEQLSEVM